MFFKLINTSNLEWDKAVDFEADSIDAACEYVLKNAYKFSNWRILQDDTVELSYKTVDGHWFIAAFIDLHKNEVVTKLYDGRRAPVPYVETSEQGEPVDVENTSASEQDNTVEKSSKKTKFFLILKKAVLFPLCILAFHFFIYLFHFLHNNYFYLNQKAFSAGQISAFSLVCILRLFYYGFYSFFQWFIRLKAVEKIKNRLPHYRKGGRKKQC